MAPAGKISARKSGTGPRPWLAIVARRPLADTLGRPIHFASRAAALLAAQRAASL